MLESIRVRFDVGRHMAMHDKPNRLQTPTLAPGAAPRVRGGILDSASDTRTPEPVRSTLEVRDGTVSAALLARLREELPTRREALAQAINATSGLDFDAVVAEAHRLAGASAYCGAQALQESAQALERAGQSAETVLVERAWDEVSALIDALLTAR